IQTLHAQGRKVIISIGGESIPVSLDNTMERDVFIASVTNIINVYGFDGLDIDLEGSSLSTSGGTIAAPTDQPMIRLIYAIRQIMANYYVQNHHRLILTMAPETAFVHGGQSAYGGIWGAYLPVINALRDSIEILQVQLYNSGSMYGIDGNIYTQGTADFIVAMCEAVIHGFNTAGGMFIGLPANKVGIGLPACSMAAGGGYTNTAVVKSAIDYLRGIGPKPGSYTLTNTAGYADIRGMMTWSINWDAAANCGSAYEYAGNFLNIFGGLVPVELLSFSGKNQGSRNIIEWETAMEINSDYFEIETGNDGRNFNTVGKVTAAGNSAQKVSYTFIDQSISKGLSYYRIKQTDRDGAIKFSKIISIYVQQPNSFSVEIYPNPAKDHFTIITNESLLNAHVDIYDIQGKNIYSEKLSNNPIYLHAPAGSFIVKVRSGKNEFTGELIIQ
ncbi:MAG: glycosyl hydrolase family 18 protein, partial [Ferruginibacter sp.]